MIDLYELNRLTSFVYTFKHDYNVYTEFVYGYVSEILDKDPFGQVTKIFLSFVFLTSRFYEKYFVKSSL